MAVAETPCSLATQREHPFCAETQRANRAGSSYLFGGGVRSPGELSSATARSHFTQKRKISGCAIGSLGELTPPGTQTDFLEVPINAPAVVESRDATHRNHRFLNPSTHETSHARPKAATAFSSVARSPKPDGILKHPDQYASPDSSGDYNRLPPPFTHSSCRIDHYTAEA